VMVCAVYPSMCSCWCLLREHSTVCPTLVHSTEFLVYCAVQSFGDYFSVTSKALQVLVYCSLLTVCFVRYLLTIFSVVLIRLTEKRKHLEDELKDAIAERDRNKMTNHHFEQELRRVQSIIDCMVQLNPHQVKHIQKIQPDFRFKVHIACVLWVYTGSLYRNCRQLSCDV
jgi:hypothetical protein